MMSPQSVLATIAEVGIAIAGFGGVIAAIASVTPQGLSRVARAIFNALLTGSIMLVCFAIVPQILGAAGVRDGTLWMTASLLHAAYLVSVVRYRAVELRKAGGSLDQLGFTIPAVLVAAIVQTSNAILFRAAWVYLAALLAVVLVVFLSFPRLLAEIWERDPMATTEET